MSTIGIIAEFNPLHSGHQYLIREASKLGTVVCILSGNFVQRGDTAIADKGIRAQAALISGADIILELPVLWSMSTAENFALGGVSAAVAAGCDTLLFGSESGNIDELIKAADILRSEQYSEALKRALADGVTFAAARQTAAEECGVIPGLLGYPNNNLAISYICAAKRIGANLKFETVKRMGAAHDSHEVSEFVSASLLRQALLADDRDFCRKFMGDEVLSLFKKEDLSDIARLDTALLCTLRQRSMASLKELPDLSEGVENKLYSAIRLATNREELYNNIKVKRYPLSRVRRLVLSAFIGAQNSFFMKSPPYVRVLGFNEKGEKHLRDCLSAAGLPIVMRVSEIDALPMGAKTVFETECRATDLFALSLTVPGKCNLEYTRPLIKI